MGRKKAQKQNQDIKEKRDDDMPRVAEWPNLYRSAILVPVDNRNLETPRSPQAPAVRTLSVWQLKDAKNVWMKHRRLKWLEHAEEALRTFTPGERLLLYILSGIFGLAALLLVNGVNSLATVTVPAAGGALVEGEIGSARFLNPLLTLSGPDEDITALVYAGLMKKMRTTVASIPLYSAQMRYFTTVRLLRRPTWCTPSSRRRTRTSIPCGAPIGPVSP